MCSNPPAALSLRQDVRIQTPNLHRQVQEVLREYHAMQTYSTFTDLDLITKDKKRISIHSLMLATSSDFFKHWMENTFSPNLHYHVLLPDFHSHEVSILVGILYGADITLEEENAHKVNELADQLGISIDLPFRTSAPQDQNVPPLCCWYCNLVFSTLDDLKSHVSSHEGQSLQKKQHKCPTCGKHLPSMWKFRQHLLKHTSPNKKNFKKADHLYAEAPKNFHDSTARSLAMSTDAAVSTNTLQQDHPYGANPEGDTPAQAVANSDHQYSAKTIIGASAGHTDTPQVVNSASVTQDVLPDHLYSSAQVQGNSQSEEGRGPVTRGHTNSRTKKSGANRSKKQSIRALGHSYAAARPRRISGVVPPIEAEMYPCDQCDKAFPLPYRLNRHIKEVHVKEKFHRCTFCDKSFYKQSSRQRHELTHTSHDLWSCSACNKSFRDESSLRYHKKHKVCSKPKKTSANRN